MEVLSGQAMVMLDSAGGAKTVSQNTEKQN
jgi:hypothetical protein